MLFFVLSVGVIDFIERKNGKLNGLIILMILVGILYSLFFFLLIVDGRIFFFICIGNVVVFFIIFLISLILNLVFSFVLLSFFMIK